MKRLSFYLLLLLSVGILPCAAQMPAVVLDDINGGKVRTDTLAHAGKPVIVSFFATWCKPCQRELTAIAEVYDDWQEQTGVRLVAISLDEAQSVNKVKPLVDGNGWPYQVLLDPGGELKRALGIQLIPFVLILDETGKIVYKHNGYTDGAENELLDKLLELGGE
ncbi:MAG: TlpA family protein disulfide reductase [Muribaculaceae bacterium]|nr:TlpA family protein disulfide reductase [Muribaculaceae bacterium]